MVEIFVKCIYHMVGAKLEISEEEAIKLITQNQLPEVLKIVNEKVDDEEDLEEYLTSHCEQKDKVRELLSKTYEYDDGLEPEKPPTPPA